MLLSVCDRFLEAVAAAALVLAAVMAWSTVAVNAMARCAPAIAQQGSHVKQHVPHMPQHAHHDVSFYQRFTAIAIFEKLAAVTMMAEIYRNSTAAPAILNHCLNISVHCLIVA